MRIAIVLLNYNGYKDTLKCLAALSKQTFTNFQIVLIDNGSNDFSIIELSRIKDVIFLREQTNHGFAGGVNIGIKYAMKHNFDAVALLNNDAIANKDWLRNLTKAMVTQHADIVTSLLLSGDGKKIDTSGDIYSYWGIHFPRQRGVASAKALNSGFIFGASGGASLYKTKLFRGIGLFDEKFFAYYEDVDISFRAQLTNHKIYYEKSAIAYHDHGTTSSKISGFTVYQTFKNLPMLFWKNVPASLLFPIGFRLFIIYCLFFASAFSRGDFRYALKGFLASVKLFPYAIHQRQKIQKSKKISTDALKSILYHQIPPDQTKLRRLFYGEK